MEKQQPFDGILLVSDIDGTLTDLTQVSRRNIEAIERFIRLGGHFTPVSYTHLNCRKTGYTVKKEGGHVMLNLQDMFLNQLRKEKIMVTVYLVNGFQLRGYVKGFDTFTIVVENEGRQNLVYKNAVSTITPTKPVKLLENIPVQPESTASEKLSAASEKETGAQQEPQAQPKPVSYTHLDVYKRQV